MDINATPRATTVDTGVLYEAVRQRFLALACSLTDEELETYVPATPLWRVRDALAHVVGIPADLNRFDPAAPVPDPDAWTAAQVEKRRADDVETMAAEWDREAPAFEDGLRLFGYEIGSHYVADLHAHLQDVRQALGLTADRDDAAVLVSLDFFLFSSHLSLIEAEAGAIDVTVGGESYHLGSGPTVAALTGDPFDVLRALSARRSASSRHSALTRRRNATSSTDYSQLNATSSTSPS